MSSADWITERQHRKRATRLGLTRSDCSTKLRPLQICVGEKAPASYCGGFRRVRGRFRPGIWAKLARRQFPAAASGSSSPCCLFLVGSMVEMRIFREGNYTTHLRENQLVVIVLRDGDNYYKLARVGGRVRSRTVVISPPYL